MCGIRILLLGRPEVIWKGEQVRIQSNTSRFLLLFLAWRGALVEKDDVRDFFASETGEDTNNILSEAIQDLQRIFSGVDLFVFESQMLELNFNLVSVDQLEFQELIDRAGRTPWDASIDALLSIDALKYFHQAEALWRGTHFLEGEEFGAFPKITQWIEAARHATERLYQNILERLADHAFAEGNYEQSLNYSRRALVYDELNEQLHYRALHSLEMIGDYEEIKRYLEMLHSQLGIHKVGHSARLLKLFRQMIKKPIDLGRPDLQSPWNLYDNPEMRFTGRLAEIWQLFQCLDRGGAVCVIGEVGMGRTRLLQEFVQMIDAHTRVLPVSCMPDQSILPFQPFIDLMRNQVQPDEWQSLDAKWTAQLALLLPELAEAQPQLALPQIHYDSGQEMDQVRILLLEAIRNLFLSISQKHRLVVCIDDIHWADEATIAAIDYLCSRPPFDDNGLLVATARSGEENPRLERWLESIKSSRSAQVIRLAPLQFKQIASLAFGISGKIFSEEFLQKLAEETQGNPLFIIETMIGFMEQKPNTELSDPFQLPVAKSLQLAVRDRIQKLDPPLRSLLEAAATIGIEFERDILVDLGHLPGVDVSSQLETLEKRMLVEYHRSSGDRVIYRFKHSIIREELLAQISPQHAQWLHKQVAGCLQKKSGLGEPIQPAVIALHFEKAGDLLAAFDYWLRAGQRACALLSEQEAWDTFHRAEQLVSRLPDFDEYKIYQLFSEMSELAFWQENAVELERLNNHLYQLGEDRKSSLLKGAALNGLGNAHFGSIHFEDGLRLIEQAIPLLEESGNLYELSLAYNRRGAFLYLLNRMEDAAAALQDSLVLSAGSQEPPMVRARGYAHAQVAAERILSGWPRTALLHAQRSLEDFSSLGQLQGQALATAQCTLAYHYLGNLHQTIENGTCTLEMAEKIQATRMVGSTSVLMALTELTYGNLDGAWGLAEYAVSLGENHGYNEVLAGGRSAMGDICLSLGDLTAAVDHYQHSLAVIGEVYASTEYLPRLGYALFRAGQVEAGEKMIRDAVRTCRQKGLGLGWVQAKMAQTAILYAQGEYKKARDAGAAVLSEIRRREMSGFSQKHRLLMAMLALKTGDAARCKRLYLDSIQEARRVNNLQVELRALTRFVQLYRGQEEIVEMQSRAQALIDAMDSRAQHPAIRRSFLEFRQNILHSLE